jgi:hypothetical protein
MINSKILLSLVLTTSLLALPTVVHAGTSDGAGGDRCEERFKSIGEDLAKWIRLGGHNSLNLTSLNGLSADLYAAGMLREISRVKISCVDPGDINFPVTVNGTPKECKNFVDSKGERRIICDRYKFYAGLKDPQHDSSQYRLAHHEYAGLAGFELPVDDDSSYAISNQITGYLHNEVVKRLAVAGSKTTSPVCTIEAYPAMPSAPSIVIFRNKRQIGKYNEEWQALEAFQEFIREGVCVSIPQPCVIGSANGSLTPKEYRRFAIHPRGTTNPPISFTRETEAEAIQQLNLLREAQICL